MLVGRRRRQTKATKLRRLAHRALDIKKLGPPKEMQTFKTQQALVIIQLSIELDSSLTFSPFPPFRLLFNNGVIPIS